MPSHIFISSDGFGPVVDIIGDPIKDFCLKGPRFFSVNREQSV